MLNGRLMLGEVTAKMRLKSKSKGQRKLVIMMPAYNAVRRIERVLDRIPHEVHPGITVNGGIIR